MVLPPDQLLHLGPDPAGASWNHFDLGLGLSSHINYPQVQLKNSPPQGAPWWYSRTNPTSGKDVVVFSAPLGGATTSTNTQYARCELREYERNGTTKMAFDPKSGDHWIEGIYRVFGLAGLDKPEVTMLQAHDGGDDVIMISTYQGGLRLRYNGSQVAVLDSSVSDGDEFYLKIRVNNGTPSVFYSSDPAVIPTSPAHTSSGFFSSAASGWYFKTGSYNQTNENTDPDVDPDASIIRIEMRELKHWHSQTPAGGAWPTPAPYTTTGTPNVNAGADSSFTLGGSFSRTATVTLNGATLSSQSWSILSGPTGVGTTLSSTASVSWTPSMAGVYTLGYSANTSAGNFSDQVTVTVTTVSTPIDTTTAAGVKGWGKPIKTDQFNRTGAPGADWGVYDGPGHSGNGRRVPARVTVDGSKLVGTGLNNGDSFGMSHRFYQQYGKWEVRMRCFETGSVIEGNRYHVVLIIWPESGEWPEDGEYDFVELSIPGQSTLGAFMHFPHDANVSVQQREFNKPGVGTGEWHNYGFEWTPNELVGYVDGVEWFRTSGGASSIRRNIQDMPSGGLTIQLDNFDGTNQTPAQMEVDWVNVYPLVPIPLDPAPDPGGGGGGGGGGTSTGAYPSFVGAGAPVTANDGSGGTINVPAPAGVLPGHFQVCAIECATAAESITNIPANWNLLDEQLITTATGGDSGDTSAVWLYYNTTGDSVSRSWVKSGTRAFHAVRLAWKDVSALGQHFVRASSSTLTPYATPVTPGTSRAIAVAILGSDRLNVTAGPVTVPTGWTSRYNQGQTVNGDEYEWISVADIQVADRAVAGANVPTETGLATSNFKLTNADSCQVFSFVLEGPISTGTVYNGGVVLPAQPRINVNLFLAPVPVGGVLLRIFPELIARSIVRGGVNLYALANLVLNASLFPRGALIIIPTLTFSTRQVSFAGLLLQAVVRLQAGALPYRRPVLRNEYEYPPEDHPFRLIAQRILDGEIVEWELPVDEDFEYTVQLSGPTVMQGSFSPEQIAVQELGLDGYAYWLHVEIGQEIRASAIMLPPQYEGSTMAFSAEGVAAAPHYTTYDAIYSQLQVDPLSVVRTLWNYVQSQPQSDYGVVLSQNSSPVRLGKLASTETTTTTNEDGTTTTNTREIPAEPYELNWWDAKNVGEEIDTLSGQTPFDYIERHRWNTERTDVEHFVDLGYPRLGVTRDNLLFNEENILEVVPVQEPEDTYASAVLVIGAGDGADTIRAFRSEPFADRVRKQVVVTDKSITSQQMADARATQELALRRGRMFEIGELTVDAYHTNAPIGSYSVGDDIQVQVEVSWLMVMHTAWYRITSIQNRPSSDRIRLGLARSDTLLDTSDVWIQPDDYVPFQPPPPVGSIGWNGNVFMLIAATLGVAPGVPVPTARISLIASSALAADGVGYGGSFAFANNLFAVHSLIINGPMGTLVALVALNGSAVLSADGLATPQGFATVSMVSPTTITIGPITQVVTTAGFGSTPFGSEPFGSEPSAGTPLRAVATLVAGANVSGAGGAVNMSAGKSLTVGARLVVQGAVTLTVGKTLSANGTVSSGTTITQLGKTTNGASTSSSSANKTVVSKATSSVNGVVTAGHARLWVDTGSASSVRMVVYSDSSGLPGSLLGSSDAITVSNTSEELKDFTFSGAQQASISNGTDYWIGFTWPDPGANNISWSRDGTAGQAQQNSLNNAASFGTPGTALTGPIDAYIDVSSSTPPPGGNAPTIVRSNSTVLGSTTNVSCSLGGTASVGNLLLFIGAWDKQPGALTMTGSGWTNAVALRSTSVSMNVAWKTAAGGETSLAGTLGSPAPPTGSSIWVAELAQDGSGAWTVVAATNNTDETTTTSKSTGTTAAASVISLGLALWAIDSTFNKAGNPSYSNGYTEIHDSPQVIDGGEAGLWVASKEIEVGQTGGSTISSAASTADQISGAAVNIGRSN